MPVDRPRRALLEEPDNVESYVAKRSLGFTQADSGDLIVARPARAARARVQTAVGTETATADREQLGLSDPPSPRRASTAEPLSWDSNEEKPTPTEPSAPGRRAIVDLEPSEPSRSVLPAQPAASPGVGQSVAESPLPRRSAPSQPLEPVVEPPKITAREVAPRDRIVVTARPTISSPAPSPPPAWTQPTEPYRRPTALTDRPTTPLPPTPAVTPPVPQTNRAEPMRAPSPDRTPTTPAVTRPVPQTNRADPVRAPSPDRAPTAPAVTRPVPQTNRADPVRAPSPDRTPTTRRAGSGPALPRLAAPVVRPTKRPRWTVDHEVRPVVVDRLIKSYNGTLAVHNLSFMVEPGRVTGFLGPNGAGKTTTMRILVGLVTPTTGTATFGDVAYADLPHPQRTVGCVLDARFHPGRSGRNHLRVLAPTAGASDRRVDQLLGEVGLGDVARQPVGEYSMGMQQRLALAAAMLGNPDYLILDEPANGLDPEGIRWLRTFLRDFAASGRAVLMSSHLLNEVEATADDIVVISRGRLLAQMPMSELNLGEGITRARVSDLAATMQTLAAIGADVETAVDERGTYLRIHSHDVGQVGSALFSAGIAVDELITERRDLEQEFFSMLEGSG
jgi:ABC-2 type transport system ATP-binding protein